MREAELDVTVVVVPRERFSATERSLRNLLDNTPAPFKLVYVGAGAPPSVQRYLEAASEKSRFRLIMPGYLSPNQARNVALREVSTKYVAFLDNDALVTPGWLDRLVQCADETGAAIVGPLYLVGEIEQQLIHMAGGTLHFKEKNGQRIVYDEHRLVDVRLDSLPAPLQRSECDFVEFHCMLGRTAFLERLGALDEGLLSLHEHIDVGWAARTAGGTVFVEPAAIASYVPPPPLEWSDLPYFMLRWSDDWSTASMDHFRKKWGVAATRHFGDEDTSLDVEDTAVRFGRAHRRRASGLNVPGVWDGTFESASDQASLMVALFQTVDRDGFDLALTGVDEHEVETHTGLTPQATLGRLPVLLQRGEAEKLNVQIRPRPPRRSSEPALVRLDIDVRTFSDVEPYAFLVLKAGAGRYQIWLAMDRSNQQSTALLRRIAATAHVRGSSTRYSRVAGSLEIEPDGEDSGPVRVTLFKGVAGRVTTAMELDGHVALSHLWSSEIY
jgi:GT2 family glycosyltransferase